MAWALIGFKRVSARLRVRALTVVRGALQLPVRRYGRSTHVSRLPLVITCVCLFGTPARAQYEAPLSELVETPVVTIRASETLKRTPDTARLQLGVESFAPSATAALQDNAAKMERLIATLRGFGVPSGAIRTSYAALDPRYEDDGASDAPRLKGYYARNAVNVITTNIDGIGTLLDAAAAPGSTTVRGLYFSLEKDEDSRRAAREAALARADREAQFIARNRGFSSARVIGVDTESTGRDSDIITTSRRIAGPTTPIEAGEVSVSASVTVRYVLTR